MTRGRSVLIAAFLVMGFWGYVHLVGGIIRAIHYRQWEQVNPYFLTRINGPLGHFGRSWWGALVGWLIFVTLIAWLSSYLYRKWR